MTNIVKKCLIIIDYDFSVFLRRKNRYKWQNFYLVKIATCVITPLYNFINDIPDNELAVSRH